MRATTDLQHEFSDVPERSESPAPRRSDVYVTRAIRRVFLRGRDTQFVLGPGHHDLGRSGDCTIVLEDPLISRRHARLVVEEARVVLEDLGSVNGIIVNGEHLSGAPRDLDDGDRIRIGNQMLEVHVERRRGDRPSDAPADNGDLRSAQLGSARPKARTKRIRAPRRHSAVNETHVAPAKSAETEVSAHDSAALVAVAEPSAARSVTADLHVEASQPNTDSPDPSHDSRFATLEIRTIIADHAIVSGHPSHAEDVLLSPLCFVLETARSGQRIELAHVERAARCALGLARATAKTGWFDYAVELLTLSRTCCTNSLADDFVGALEQVRSADVAKLDAYACAIRELTPSLDKLRTLQHIERLRAAAISR